MCSNRWGNCNNDQINETIKKLTPKNTVLNKESQWRQFMDFCNSKNYKIDRNTTIPELAEIMKNWAFNMKRKDGSEYKESVIKTLWNNTAKTLQEMYYKKYNIKFNPFKDIEFLDARKAKDYKRKELQNDPNKRKVSALAFTLNEHNKMQKIWDENTPDGLQKKFYIIASKELAWRGNEAVFAKIYYFQIETSNNGYPTGRIEYNPVFSKTHQGGDKRCTDSKWLVQNSNEDVCPVRLYHKIIGKRPKNATTDRFFLTPNPNWCLSSTSNWFKNIPVGINKLSLWTKETAEKIGLDTVNKKFTNHSNRSTAVTHLANANIPEQQLIKITGHSNTNSIQSYLNMQPNHHQDIINSLRGNNPETPEITHNITVSNSTIQSCTSNPQDTNPQIVYQNCVFNVQNMYCGNK